MTVSRLIIKPLDAANGFRIARRNLLRHIQSMGYRVVMNARQKADIQCFIGFKNTPRHGKFFQNVFACQARHDMSGAHIRHQTPFDFHDGKLRARRGKAYVGAHENLKDAAQRKPMRGCNDRHPNFAPDAGDFLRHIGLAVCAFDKRFARQFLGAVGFVCRRAEIAHIKAGTKGPPFAR